MVKFSTITQANARFASDNKNNSGLVCVFTGATGGIGAGTIERLAVMLQSPTFYVLGRSLKIVFLEAEVSLISDIDAVSKKIISAEKKVDYLCMSPACFPINVPQYTKEGLDLSFAPQYYSRMRLTMNLLPLRHKSPRPRILNVMNGGNEKPLLETDVGLSNPANYSWSAAINHTTTLTTLSFRIPR